MAFTIWRFRSGNGLFIDDSDELLHPGGAILLHTAGAVTAPNLLLIHGDGAFAQIHAVPDEPMTSA